MKCVTWFCAVVLLACTWRGHGATIHVARRSPFNGPGTDWRTAFHTVQAGVDAATNAGDVVLVTDGMYRPGTEIVVSNAITVRSENGASVTTIDGEDAYRCFSLANVACTINGFTITRGCATNAYPYDRGGGVYSTGYTAVVSDCALSSNRASYGGACNLVKLHDCVLSDNTADRNGGACNYGMLTDCVLSGNSAAPSSMAH